MSQYVVPITVGTTEAKVREANVFYRASNKYNLIIFFKTCDSIVTVYYIFLYIIKRQVCASTTEKLNYSRMNIRSAFVRWRVLKSTKAFRISYQCASNHT